MESTNTAKLTKGEIIETHKKTKWQVPRVTHTIKVKIKPKSLSGNSS